MKSMVGTYVLLYFKFKNLKDIKMELGQGNVTCQIQSDCLTVAFQRTDVSLGKIDMQWFESKFSKVAYTSSKYNIKGWISSTFYPNPDFFQVWSLWDKNHRKMAIFTFINIWPWPNPWPLVKITVPLFIKCALLGCTFASSMNSVGEKASEIRPIVTIFTLFFQIWPLPLTLNFWSRLMVPVSLHARNWVTAVP